MITKEDTKLYHRNQVSSSWEAALLHGNTAERTQTACCRHRSHLYCWRSHTCPAHRFGCKVQGQSVWCRSSKTLNATSGCRWFAKRKKENNTDEDTQMQMHILLNITNAHTMWIMNSQTLCMNLARSHLPLIHLPLHTGPHTHHLDDGLYVCCQTRWG